MLDNKLTYAENIEFYWRNQELWWNQANFWVQIILTLSTLAVLLFSYRALKQSEESLKLSKEALELTRESIIRELYPNVHVSLNQDFAFENSRYWTFHFNLNIYNRGLAPTSIISIKAILSPIDIDSEYDFLWRQFQALFLPPSNSQWVIPPQQCFQLKQSLHLEGTEKNLLRFIESPIPFPIEFFESELIYVLEDIDNNNYTTEKISLRNIPLYRSYYNDLEKG